MLINISEIIKLIKVKITGVLHIGAHECEELPFYRDVLNVREDDMVWIDALEYKVNQAKNKGVKNVYHATITDKDFEKVNFNISNNYESSSILEFGTHSKSYPGIVYTHTITQKSITIDTFFEQNNLDSIKYNFWNLDIQGAELLALKGGLKSLKNADVIYIEVNTEEVYKNCALLKDIDKFLGENSFERVIMSIKTNQYWGDAMYIRKFK